MEQINHCDCLDFMRGCPSEIFDLAIADPPYFEIYGDFDYIWENVDQYIEWSKAWITELHRVLKPTGSFYLWGKIGFGKGFPLFKICDWMEKEKLFIIRNWITQRNSRGRGNKKGYMEAREELVFSTKSREYTWHNAYTKEKTNRRDAGFDGKPRKSAYKRVSDVWTDIAEASQSSRERFAIHGKNFPTVKSQGLCQRIVEASSNPGDLVFIPFGGSGSEAIACELLGRKWILTEISQDYINDIIVPRFSTLHRAKLGYNQDEL